MHSIGVDKINILEISLLILEMIKNKFRVWFVSLFGIAVGVGGMIFCHQGINGIQINWV